MFNEILKPLSKKELLYQNKDLLRRIWKFCSYCQYRNENNCEGYAEKIYLPFEYKGCEFLEIFRDYKFVFPKEQ